MEGDLLMPEVDESLLRLQLHEEMCLERYTGIQRSLDEGKARFDRMDKMIMAMYPFMIGAIAAAKWL